MAKTLKTAPELERYILIELRNCAACNAVTAVTVAATEPQGWEVSHINALGGVVPQVCIDICSRTVEQLRDRFDLVTEIEPDEL